MTSMRRALVLDTNVWLDTFFGSRPGCAVATQLVTAAAAAEVPLLYAATTLKDVFFLAASHLKRLERQNRGAVSSEAASSANEVAWACVNNMLENGTLIAVDYSDAWLAAKLKAVHSDFEDDLVMAALKRAGADHLVTTDQQLLVRFPETAITPQQALELLQDAE